MGQDDHLAIVRGYADALDADAADRTGHGRLSLERNDRGARPATVSAHWMKGGKDRIR